MGSAYEINRPSVVEAYHLTTIFCDGIHRTKNRLGSIRTYPFGRVFCACCNTWKYFDADRPVWAVRDGWGGGELLIEGLVCDECSNSDDIVYIPGVRQAPLVHEESLWEIKRTCNNRNASKVIRQWKKFVKLQKERKETALMVAMVCNKMIKNCNITPILDSVISQFNGMHSLTT